MQRRDAIRIALGSAAALAAGARALDAGPSQRPPRTAVDPLDLARRAGEWLLRHARPTDAGSAWPTAPGSGDAALTNLYTGNAGIVLFLLELHAATGDGRFRDAALAGAHELAAGQIARDLERGNAGLYSGAAGLAFTLGVVGRVTGERHFGDAARDGGVGIVRAARSHADGADWGDVTDIVSGSAGIGLFLLHAAATLEVPGALDRAADAGRRLSALGVPDRGGLRWPMAPTVPRNYPNFSHGTAGIAYFLAELHRATGDAAFLRAALAGATYLDAIATRADDGTLIFHSEPGNEDLYYLSWCHGPPGTARLYRALARTTRDERWHGRLRAAALGVLGTGVPEQRTPGYWNNISQCCGDAGVGEFFLALHRLDPREEYIDMAQRAAAWLHAHVTLDAHGGACWIQAEHRVRPAETVAQTGLMQGAAGAGLFLLRLHGWESGRAPVFSLPDSPFG